MLYHLNHFPVLKTTRLTLRQLSQDDCEEIFLLRSDPTVNKFLGRKKAVTLDDAKHFIQKINAGIANHESLYWGLQLLNQPGLIGTICLWNFDKNNGAAEIGYELLPGHCGLGLMQEAVHEVISFAFATLKLKKIVAELDIHNDRSIRLLGKNKFVKDNAADVKQLEDENMTRYILLNTTVS